MKRFVTRATLTGLFVAVCALSASAQTKVYRGSIGNSHIQMRLNFNGSDVSGTYAYDSIGENLKLTGRAGNDGALELIEFSGKQKTGKFVCKRPIGVPVDSECTWSKIDGTRESMVTLEEQNFAFADGIQVTPKMIANRRTGVSVSYPQITGSGPLSAQSFNRRILALLQKAIGEFQPIDGKGVFDTNYNILLGNNDLISVEMTEYADVGGAHPSDHFWSLTYALAANRELKFADLFQPGSDYNNTIAKYVVADIDRRAKAMEDDEARSENRQPVKRDDSIVSEDQLDELSGWAISPKGLVVYFDFPHVIAVFDKTLVPFSVVKQYLNPNGPAARFQ